MPALSFNFINGTGSDVAATIKKLHNKCLPDKDWTLESLQSMLSQDSVYSVIAKKDALEIGFCIYRIAADEAEIISIGVLENERMNGHATEILKETIKKISDSNMNIRKIFLEVAEDNLAAINLYLSAKFRKAGVRKKYYQRKNGERVDAVIMALDN